MSDTPFRYCLRVQTDPTAKSVLLAIAFFADESGHCELAFRDLARYTCLGEQAISRAVKRLVDDGHLSRVYTPGRSAGSSYTLLMHTR